MSDWAAAISRRSDSVPNHGNAWLTEMFDSCGPTRVWAPARCWVNDSAGFGRVDACGMRARAAWYSRNAPRTRGLPSSASAISAASAGSLLEA